METSPLDYLVRQNCDTLIAPYNEGDVFQHSADYKFDLVSPKAPIYIKILNPPSHKSENIYVTLSLRIGDRIFPERILIPKEKNSCWIININQRPYLHFFIQQSPIKTGKKVEMKILEIDPDWAYYIETKSSLVKDEYIQFVVWKAVP